MISPNPFKILALDQTIKCKIRHASCTDELLQCCDCRTANDYVNSLLGRD